MFNFLSGSQAQRIADAFGTPVYVYSRQTLENSIDTLQKMLPQSIDSAVLYAVKANSNPYITKIAIQKGLGIDAVSLGEIILALKCGAHPSNILFTESNASSADIDQAISMNVTINCGSLSSLLYIGQKYGTKINKAKGYNPPKVCIRLTTEKGGGHHQKTSTYGFGSKFGIWWEDWKIALEICREYGISLSGLHQHIGSGIYDIATFEEVIDPLLEVAKFFPEIKFLDFGGGFATRYKEEENELDIAALGIFMAQKIHNWKNLTGRSIKVMIEPGRYVVNDSGILLTKVNTIKTNPLKQFIGVDTGFNHLIRYAMYGSYHHILNLSAIESNEEWHTYDIAGNLCESSDFLAKDRLLPLTDEGDLLAVLSAGAYGMSMSSNYNLYSQPAEVMIENNGDFKLIRKRENVEDLLDRTGLNLI
jgi:diaminopimelate decarboxylase